jgi:ATP-dependent Clp protease, protease subunit
MKILYLDTIDSNAVRQVLDSRPPQTLWINSEGGSITDALALYDLIVGRDVTVVATGQCASAAVLVLLAGSRRLATPHCRLMLHPISMQGVDGAPLTQADAIERHHLQTIIADIIHERTGQEILLSPDKVYFGAVAALKMGFIHAIWEPE